MGVTLHNRGVCCSCYRNRKVLTSNFQARISHETAVWVPLHGRTYPTFIETYTLDIQPDLSITTFSTATSSGMLDFGPYNHGPSAAMVSAPLAVAVQHARSPRGKRAAMRPASSNLAVQHAGPSRDESAVIASAPPALSPEDAMNLAAFFGPLKKPNSEFFMLI